MKITNNERFHIKLNNGYQITADSRQYILQKVITPVDGKQYTKNVAYAGTIKQLITCMLEKEIKNSFIVEIEQIKTLINSTAEEIAKQFTV